MEPTNRSNVGNSTGGQNLPPSDGPQQSGYDPIFSPTGMAGTDKGIYRDNTPAPAPTPAPTPAAPAPAPIAPAPTPTPAPQPVTPQPITSATTSNHTASTAAGDIILQQPSTPARKPQLPLIIGLIAAGILIIAGLIILIINPFHGSSHSTTSTVTSFNKFINYLYDGSDATGVNADVYTDGVVYKFQEMFDSDDQSARSEYFTTAQSLLSDVQTSAQAESLNDEELTTTLSQASELLDFLATYASIEFFQSEDIIALVLQDGDSAARQYAQDNYTPLLNSSNPAAQAYGQILQIRANQGLAVGRAYADAHCAVKSESTTNIDACLQLNLTLTTDYQGQIIAITQSDSYMTIGDAKSEFFDDCYYVSYLLEIDPTEEES